MISVVLYEEKSGMLTATLEFVSNATGSSLVEEVGAERVEDLPRDHISARWSELLIQYSIDDSLKVTHLT